MLAVSIGRKTVKSILGDADDEAEDEDDDEDDDEVDAAKIDKVSLISSKSS